MKNEGKILVALFCVCMVIAGAWIGDSADWHVRLYGRLIIFGAVVPLMLAVYYLFVEIERNGQTVLTKLDKAATEVLEKEANIVQTEEMAPQLSQDNVVSEVSEPVLTSEPQQTDTVEVQPIIEGTEIRQLAEAHWKYNEGVLQKLWGRMNPFGTEDMKQYVLELIAYYYTEAMVHGYKHREEEL